ncbi:MAG: cob(I)yrinic acid a,c-diamide adenosyltransferase [Thermoguttaceae bacterium]|nr:cob(I)yrinic acid a,c-diamide adenosyltransferase [Thermoguttaceae bacterium]MDW8078235.1 cob(I)yrinic acid a,c-diamide adenosyltransferase [Thermoguttaceae bacterium]
MSKIYTRAGDRGETGLLGGIRVSKSHPRIETNGAIDELNAVLALCRVEKPDPDVDQVLRQVQNEIGWMASEIACPIPNRESVRVIQAEHVSQLEKYIDHFDSLLPPLRHFIVPGGTRLAAFLNLARTVCRRAERWLVRLRDQEPEVRQVLVAYLNRLGDLLFVLMRLANHRQGVPDEIWPPESAVPPSGQNHRGE